MGDFFCRLDNLGVAGGVVGPVHTTNFSIHLTFDPSTTPLLTDYDDFHPRSAASGKNVVFMDDHVTALEWSDLQ